MLGFCVTAPMLDVAAKLASSSVPVGQITAARFIVQCALMAPCILVMGLSLYVARGQWLALISRALLLLIATFCFITAIRVMPLAVIQPSFAAFGAVALIPLGTAVAFAFYILVTRGLSRQLHPVTLQFHTGLIASLFCIPVLLLAQGSGSELLDPVRPKGIAWVWLFGAGFFATLSHTTLAPLQYFELPVATLFGYLVFHDFPNALSLLGIVIIVGAGLYMIHRERVTARQLMTERAAPPV